MGTDELRGEFYFEIDGRKVKSDGFQPVEICDAANEADVFAVPEDFPYPDSFEMTVNLKNKDARRFYKILRAQKNRAGRLVRTIRRMREKDRRMILKGERYV